MAHETLKLLEIMDQMPMFSTHEPRQNPRCQYNLSTCPGCADPDHEILRNQLTEQQHRRIFFDNIMGTNALRKIQSPGAHRDQLFMFFTNNLVWLQQIPARHALLQRLRDWFEPRSDVMGIATDCLLLKHLAHVTADPTLQTSAEQRHAYAVCALSERLRAPIAANSDDVLAAADALGVCQLYEGRPRKAHADALTNILRARGPKHVRCAAGLTRSLVFNAMHICMIQGIVNREAVLFGEPLWQRKLKSTCQGKVWCLFHMTCRVPALLERVDSIKPDSLADSADLLNELLQLENSIQSWMLVLCKEEVTSAFELTSIMQFPEFVAQCGPAAAETFPDVYNYTSGFTAAMAHLTYWTMLMPLREAIFDMSIRPELAFLTTSSYHEFRLQAVNECAESICRMAPFIVTQSGDRQLSAAERSVYGSLSIVLKWFERIEHADRAAYCRAVLRCRRRHMPETENSLSPVPWVDVDGYMMRRIWWQDAVGPSQCAEFPVQAPNRYMFANDVNDELGPSQA